MSIHHEERKQIMKKISHLKKGNDCCSGKVDCNAEIGPCGPNGCTGVPNFNVIDCCNEHDKDYCRGGTEMDRENADKKLRNCIAERRNCVFLINEKGEHEPAGDCEIAWLYYIGVRAFGSSFFCHRDHKRKN